ncbi:MAG: hypothetical protein JWO14_144 [Solirubrobacterales bacterium]|nr:hypothetical protein [Solirubrobacterales bacterium]
MRRIALLLTAFAALAVPTGARASDAKSGTALFAHGISPQGERWSATAGVRPNRRRHLWRFDINFKFSNGYGWGSGQEIPIGSHEHMEREADGYTGLLSGGAPESAAFGYAGPEVTTIKMKMSDGSSLEVHPVLPPVSLRHQFIWMRGFRYFIQFYPGGAYVTEYWLYNKAGMQVGCEIYAEGELGPSVCGTIPVT